MLSLSPEPGDSEWTAWSTANRSANGICWSLRLCFES